MVPLKAGTLSPGLWSVLNWGAANTIVWLSFSPDLRAAASCWAISWCSDCSSWARPASKSDTVICGVDDGSVPPPVACRFVTWILDPSNGSQQFSICVIVWSPTLPPEPGFTAMTLTVFWPPFQGTTVSPDVCANSRPLLFNSRWPYLKTRPGEVVPKVGFKSFV